MGLIVRMPLINVNDEAADLVRWEVADGASVRKDDVLCVIETTKSTVDVLADAAGTLRQLVPAEARYAVGQPIAFLAATPDEAVPDLTQIGTAARQAAPAATVAGPVASASASAGADADLPAITHKARIVAARLGVDLAALAARHPGVRITEDLVLAAARGAPAAPAQAAAQQAGTRTAASPSASVSAQETPRSASHTGALSGRRGAERVLILGGGGGAALVIDILARGTTQQAVAILDNNAALHGTALMGVPILGGFDAAEALWRAGAFDALISTVVRDVNDRADIFERFCALGIPFTNVIDPDVRVGLEVSLGRGNLIIYGGYLATGVTLGDNNFLAAGTYIEHHSRVGSHCTFGPRCALSGKVMVGDRVKFGTQVAVEPQIDIGAGALIASGVVLTTHVPANTLVKSAATPTQRPRR